MKMKYDQPTMSFPYRINRRLNLLSTPRRYYVDTGEGMPELSPTGVRKSALRGHVNERVNDAALPYIRRLITLKRMYKNRFSSKRLERLDRMIEVCNASMYTKLANCAVKLKVPDNLKDKQKKKSWTDSEWKKHTDYIQNICKPKPVFVPEPIWRGPRKPLIELLPRIEELAVVPESKVYRRLSEEGWYKNPEKVSPKALKYIISDRVKKLSEPKAVRTEA